MPDSHFFAQIRYDNRRRPAATDQADQVRIQTIIGNQLFYDLANFGHCNIHCLTAQFFHRAACHRRQCTPCDLCRFHISGSIVIRRHITQNICGTCQCKRITPAICTGNDRIIRCIIFARSDQFDLWILHLISVGKDLILFLCDMCRSWSDIYDLTSTHHDHTASGNSKCTHIQRSQI